MRLLSAAVFTLLVITSFTIISCSDSGPIAPPLTGYCTHLPLTVGNKWVYAVTASGQGQTLDTNEMELEVASNLGTFEGFDAWGILKSLNGEPNGRIIGGCDGDRCYIYNESDGVWRFLIADKTPPERVAETETGLLSGVKMGYSEGHTTTVPAGTFEDCKLLSAHHEWTEDKGFTSYHYHVRDYKEYFAPDVGLVYHRYYWKTDRYFLFLPTGSDSGEDIHELSSYEVSVSD